MEKLFGAGLGEIVSFFFLFFFFNFITKEINKKTKKHAHTYVCIYSTTPPQVRYDTRSICKAEKN